MFFEVIAEKQLVVKIVKIKNDMKFVPLINDKRHNNQIKKEGESDCPGSPLLVVITN
jgi:hypothetical protein